jgi:short-subunit dehydrogenase
MKIFLTGASSGIGAALFETLSVDHQVIAPNRNTFDLTNTKHIDDLDVDFDMLINCAGTGLGGKQQFANHCSNDVVEIFNTNLLAPILLTKNVLKINPACKIVNITSTNNNRYWPGDLVYSLTKSSLSIFGDMLRVEYPDCCLLEIRLGLTKTNFNKARYKNTPDRYQDIYNNPHLLPENVANKIVSVLFDNTVKYIEISP